MKLKLGRKWTIVIASVIIVAGVIFTFFYQSIVNPVFNRSEYVKEVIVQNQNFEDLLDNFLDEVVNYTGTIENTKNLESSAYKLNSFIEVLKEKLGPKVPYDSKAHYHKMLDAYNIYLKSVEIYKKAVPKIPGDERNSQLKEADDKLKEAQTAMKNLE